MSIHINTINAVVKRGISKAKGKRTNGDPVLPVTDIRVNQALSKSPLRFNASGRANLSLHINDELAVHSDPELKQVRVTPQETQTSERVGDISAKIVDKLT